MTTPTPRQRLTLFDLPLDVVTLDGTLDRLGDWIYHQPRAPHTVVTLNPEFIVQSRTQPDFVTVINQADLVTGGTVEGSSGDDAIVSAGATLDLTSTKLSSVEIVRAVISTSTVPRQRP